MSARPANNRRLIGRRHRSLAARSCASWRRQCSWAVGRLAAPLAGAESDQRRLLRLLLQRSLAAAAAAAAAAEAAAAAAGQRGAARNLAPVQDARPLIDELRPAHGKSERAEVARGRPRRPDVRRLAARAQWPDTRLSLIGPPRPRALQRQPPASSASSASSAHCERAGATSASGHFPAKYLPAPELELAGRASSIFVASRPPGRRADLALCARSGEERRAASGEGRAGGGERAAGTRSASLRRDNLNPAWPR